MNTTPTPTSGPDTRIPQPSANEVVVVPVIEEQAFIHREIVETGRVHISKTVQEREEDVQFTLLHDEVQVERVPVNAFVPDGSTMPGVRYEGDTMIIPVVREVVVKRMLVVEELRVTKHEVSTQESHRVVLRQESVQVNRQSVNQPSTGASAPTDAPVL